MQRFDEEVHRRSARRRPVLVLLLALTLVAAACGPTEEAEELARSGLQNAGAVQVAAGQGEDAPGAVAVGEVSTGAEPGVGTGTGVGAAAGTAGASGGSGSGSAERSGAGADPAGGSQPAAAAPGGPTPGVTDDEIRIGVHLPETLGGVEVGRVLKWRESVEAFVKGINARGGIQGRKLRLHLEDDKYNPDGALQACRNLIAKDVFLVTGPGGADQIVACAKYATEQGIPYASLGVSEAGLMGRAGYWALTMTYDQQSALLAKFAVRKLGGDKKNLAMLRMNTPNVAGPRKAFVDTARSLGGKVVVDDAVSKDPNPSELQAECIKMQQADVEIVYLLGSGLLMAQAAQACQSQGYEPQWLGIGNTAACPTEPPLGNAAMDGCLTFSTFHEAEDTDTEIERRARDDWAKYQSGEFLPENVFIWAYFDVIVKALTDAGQSLTRAGFNGAMAALKYDNGFMNPIDFQGGQVGGHGVTLMRGDAEKARLVEIDFTWRNDF